MFAFLTFFPGVSSLFDLQSFFLDFKGKSNGYFRPSLFTPGLKETFLSCLVND